MGVGFFVQNNMRYYSARDLIEIVRRNFKILKTSPPGDVTDWMDLIRTCRQPQMLWEIDYIKPRPELLEVNDMIRQSEEMLYGSKSRLSLINGYQAEISQQCAFNSIRTHLRAEEGDCELGQSMILEILKQYYDDLPVIRQSNLLFHACLISLCCNSFQQSFECMEKHWALLKYLPPDERVQIGIWDNHVILQMMYWSFCKYVEEFKDFYSIKTNTNANDIWNHKKIALLHFLEYDNAWMASFCGLPFYNHARKQFPSLPQYEQKRSTPTNIDNLIYRNDEIFSETSPVGEEKYYYIQYNHEISTTSRTFNADKAEDFLYSYYHYQNDYVQDITNKRDLYQFVSENIPENKRFSSVLEPGCGIDSLPNLLGWDYIGIDISEKVCNILREKRISHVHSPITAFLERTEQHFDLCFACRILNHLAPHKLNMFLKLCSEKCKHLAALISISDDYRSDILSPKQVTKTVNLHKTVRPPQAWISLLSPCFDVKHKILGDELYVFCTSKLS